MASSHWVTLSANWRCQLDQFTDPKTSATQDIWAVEYLTINSTSIECATGYDLTATIQMIGQIPTMNRGGVSFPKAQFQLEFASVGPTGSTTKTKQKIEFGFLKGIMKKI